MPPFLFSYPSFNFEQIKNKEPLGCLEQFRLLAKRNKDTLNIFQSAAILFMTLLCAFFQGTMHNEVVKIFFCSSTGYKLKSFEFWVVFCPEYFFC